MYVALPAYGGNGVPPARIRGQPNFTLYLELVKNCNAHLEAYLDWPDELVFAETDLDTLAMPDGAPSVSVLCRRGHVWWLGSPRGKWDALYMDVEK